MPFADEQPLATAPSGGRFADDSPTAAPKPVAPAPSSADSLITKYSSQYGVPEDFVRRIQKQESGGSDSAVSPVGARGRFQIMPSTFAGLGVGSNINDPEQNIHGGIKYLAEQYHRYGGREDLAAAAYNAGPGAVDAAHGVPHFRETQAYVQATAAPNHGQFADDSPTSQTPTGGKFADEAPARSVATPTPTETHQAYGAPARFHRAEAKPLSPLEGLYHGALMAGTDTMGGINAVLGAPQRAVAGALTGDVGATTHPFDEARQGKLETKTESLPVVHQLAEALGNAGWGLGTLSDKIAHLVGHETHNADFLQKVGKVFAAQAVTDPLTYLPLIGEAKMAKGAAVAWETASKGAEAVGAKVPALGKATKDAKDYHDNLIKPFVKNVFGTRTELDPILTTGNKSEVSGKAARLSIEQKASDEKASEGMRQNDLAHKYGKEIKAAKNFQDLPHEVQQESMREAWRHGTPEMRSKVENDPEFKFTPTEEDIKQFPKPSGLLNYNPRKDYVTLISPKPPATYADTELVKSYGGDKRPAFSGFEKHAKADEQVHDDMLERITNRWRLGRNLVASRQIDAETKDFLLNHGGSRIPATPENVDSIVAQLTKSGPSYEIPGWTSTVRRLARGGIQLNPLPHGGKNVPDLAELAGGPEAFGHGLGYVSTGVPKDMLERMKNMGVSADYMHEAEGPITALANKMGSNQLLSRMEMGYRAGLLKVLDKTIGPSQSVADEYKKAQVIRDTMVDYRNNSKFIATLNALGGPFVVFHIKSLGAVAKATLKNPARVESRARATTDVNQELHNEKQSADFHYGGPVEAASRAVAKPYDTLTSAAMVGPEAHEALQLASGKEGLFKALQHAVSGNIPASAELIPIIRQIPGGAEWLKKMGIGFDDPRGITPFNDALNAAYGTYFSAPTGKTRRREIELQTRGIR